MKRFLSVLLILAMLVSALPQTGFAATASHEHTEELPSVSATAGEPSASPETDAPKNLKN